MITYAALKNRKLQILQSDLLQLEQSNYLVWSNFSTLPRLTFFFALKKSLKNFELSLMLTRQSTKKKRTKLARNHKTFFPRNLL